MTKQELEAKFDNLLSACKGKGVEVVDATNLNQCFDWAVRWCMELGFKNSIFSGLLYAYQIWNPSTKIAKDNFDFIPNSPTAVPQKGDIIVFNTKVGIAGHVSVATGKGDTNTFESSDQNWNGKLFIQLVTHNYDAVLGWLRLKVTQPTQPMARTPEDAAYIAGLEKAVNTKDGQIQTLEDENLDLSRQIETERSNHKAELEAKAKDCQDKINEIIALPPVVHDVVTEIPKQAKNQWLNGLIQFLYTLDR